VGLDEPLAVAGEIAQLAGDRWRHEAAPAAGHAPAAAASQAASPTSSCGRAGSRAWWAPASSRSNPRSSKTYQIGFQYWPVPPPATWVTPSAASQSASASRPAVKVAKVRTSWRRARPSGQGHARRPRPHRCPRPARCSVPLPVPPPPPPTPQIADRIAAVPGGADRINDAETRARSKQFVVPERPPHQS
jgi:hypothetical protein